MNKKEVAKRITALMVCLVMVVASVPLTSIKVNAKELNLHFDHVATLENCATGLDLIYDESTDKYSIEVACDGLDTTIGLEQNQMGEDEQINWWVTDDDSNYVVSVSHGVPGLPLPTSWTDSRENVSLVEETTYRLYCVGVDDSGNYLVVNPDYFEFSIPASEPAVKGEFTEQPIDKKSEVGETLTDTFTFKGDIKLAYLEKEVDGAWKDWNALTPVSEEQYQLEIESPKSECIEKYRISILCEGSWVYSDEFLITWEEATWKNLHWDGNVARWDNYSDATNYWIYLYKDGSNLAGGGFDTKHMNYFDFTEKMTLYGSGNYTFRISPYIDNKWDDSKKSPESGVNNFVLPDVNLEAPTNPRWDGVIAIWDPSENGQKYAVNLYKDGGLINSSIDAGSDTYIRLNSFMDQGGTGNYTFEVCAFGAGTKSEWSTRSGETSYTQIPIPTGLKLDGTIASWKPVDEATNYWYRLYKDGVEVKVGATGNTTTYDFAEAMKTYGEGVYDFKVAAYVNGAYGRDSILASEEVVHEHEWSTVWQSDSINHWYACSGCDEKKDEGIHDFSDQEYKTDIPGKHYQLCKVCSTGSSEPVDCTPSDVIKENVVEPTYETKGSHDEVIVCEICGQELSRSTVIDPVLEKPTEEPTEEDTQASTEVTIPVLSDGTVKTVGKATYMVVDSENKGVEFKATSATGSVVIPATVVIDEVEYSVTNIADNAFKNNKKITKVTIPASVKTIGKNTFYGCTKLKTVTFKSGSKLVGIGDKAFYKCSALTKITIPAKVAKVGKQAFYNCKKLKTVTIQSTKLKTSKVGSKAFSGINAKAKIKVPKSKLKTYKTLLKKKGITGKKQKITK